MPTSPATAGSRPASDGASSGGVPYPLRDVSCRGRDAGCPALCPARAVASRIPLGRGPSLHRLRRGSRPLVRPLQRYYGPVRLLHSVHLRLRIPSFPSRPRYDHRGRVKTSQVPVGGVHTCLGSRTPPACAATDASSPASRPMTHGSRWKRGRLLLRSAGLSPATPTPVSLALEVSCFRRSRPPATGSPRTSCASPFPSCPEQVHCCPV